MCDAAAEPSSERFISVILHDRRVSLTLAKIPVHGRKDDDFAKCEIITATIRKILEGPWPTPSVAISTCAPAGCVVDATPTMALTITSCPAVTPPAGAVTVKPYSPG